MSRPSPTLAGCMRPGARTALLDNSGHEALATGQAFTDAQILGMNSLVQGVQGKLN